MVRPSGELSDDIVETPLLRQIVEMEVESLELELQGIVKIDA